MSAARILPGCGFWEQTYGTNAFRRAPDEGVPCTIVEVVQTYSNGAPRLYRVRYDGNHTANVGNREIEVQS